MNSDNLKYSAKDLLEWIRDLFVLHLVNYRSSNLITDEWNRDFFVNLSGCISTEEVILRKKIYSLMSALNLGKNLSSKFVLTMNEEELHQLLEKYIDKIEMWTQYLNMSGRDFFQTIRFLIGIECQNPIKYFVNIKNIPNQSGFFFLPHYKNLAKKITEIEDIYRNVDKFIIQIFDKQQQEFTETYLINNHKFPIKVENKYFWLLDLSELKNLNFYEVKLDKTKFDNFQQLLNFIFANFLTSLVQPNTYGQKWILENEFGEIIEKQSNNSDNIMERHNINNYIKIVIKQ